MQPDVPNQNQPQGGYQPATNVPDYLQLGSTPPVKKSKKPLVIGTLLLVVFAGVAVLALPFLLRQTSPNEQFYSALDSMLQARYVTRAYTVTEGADQVFKATIASDFTDSARPKSTIDYTFFSAGEEASDNGLYQGNIVVTNVTDFSARLARSQNKLPEGASLNKWYKISNPTVSTTTTTAAVFDYLKLRSMFNSVYSLPPLGDFDDSIRAQVIETVRSKEAFRVKSQNPDTLSGKSVTRYSVTVDFPALGIIYDDIAKGLNIDKSTLSFVNISSDVTFWVDDSTGTITKSLQKTTSGSKQTIETRYDYPSTLNIKDPTPVTTLP